jgi:hypothetical protein
VTLYERVLGVDHLKEIPDYYTRLAKMEKKAGVKHESILSLSGEKTAQGSGAMHGGIGLAGSLGYQQIWKEEEKARRLRKLGLKRTPL